MKYFTIKILNAFLFLLINVFGPSSYCPAEESQNNPILIISSYNPETSQTSNNISAFIDEYKLLGGKSSIIIENMNCKSFNEAPLWKKMMSNILSKYNASSTPSLIILLGQEAWSSYISQNDSVLRKIPVICGMVSRNALILPDDSTHYNTWEPKSIDSFDEARNMNVVAGYAYEYDVPKNIELILDFYPDTKHIAFISDNSYGGVSMQALVKEKMKEFPQLDLIVLDGHQSSIYTVLDQISNLPPQTAILIGTWRVDKQDGYFMKATYTMQETNPKVPAFTLASLGLGHWTIGGYIPDYHTVGKDMAHQVISYFNKSKKHQLKIELVPNKYVFDVKKLKDFGFEHKKLPINSTFVNQSISFYELYRYEIWGVILAFCTLLLGFLVAVYFYLRTKKLKDELEASEAELIEAKDRAEESNRLKSAFLANMSHEIRTPLNAIVGFSNVLIMGNSTPEEQKSYFNIIQSNSDLLLHLINDILDISRLESNRNKFTFEKCNIVSLCEIVLSTAGCNQHNGVEYKFHSPVKAFELVTDTQRLQQVLINLLSNARKFTAKGSIILAFKIKEQEGIIEFSVTDTGRGIPEDKQKLIFERFEKLDEYVQGTGLGLSICKLTIEKLGGKIWVDPTYKEGARFIFTHPLNIQIS